MVRPFQEYENEGAVQKQQPDVNEARALMAKAERRLAYVKDRPVQEQNADLIFEDTYDVMREASQALMSTSGYKPLTHEVVVAYLRDKEKLDQTFVQKFDGYRKTKEPITILSPNNQSDKSTRSDRIRNRATRLTEISAKSIRNRKLLI